MAGFFATSRPVCHCHHYVSYDQSDNLAHFSLVLVSGLGLGRGVGNSLSRLQDLAGQVDEWVQAIAATHAELARTLSNRKNQLASLERLQNMMKRAEIQIESTLSALGTIYSQILTGQSTNHVADYSRLSTEVDEEVRGLQDHLEALEEVKLGRG